MPSIRVRRLTTPLMIAGIMLPTLAAPQNMGFWKDSAVSYFDDKDVALMMQTADEALNDTNSPSTREWKNAASGNSGKAEVLSAFKNSAGTPCKRVRFSSLVHNGVTGSSAYTYCKQAEKWMIVSKNSK